MGIKTPKTVVVIPAYNEEKRVGAVVRESKKYVDEVLVVDDGSRDRTSQVAKAAGARVLRLHENKGVGFATRRGLQFAVHRLGAGRLVLLDADGQHAPSDIPMLLEKLSDGFDIVFASRKLAGQMPFIKRAGNAWLTVMSRVLTGVNSSDSQSGFKAMTANAFERMDLRSERYEICSEIMFEVGRKRLKYCELPIKTRYLASRERGVSIFDGLRIFIQILEMTLR